MDGLCWEFVFIKLEGFFDGIGGSKEWELRFWCCCCLFVCVGKRGLVILEVCFWVNDEDRNELSNFDKEEVFKNLILGEGILLYKLMDCLKNNLSTISIWKLK